MPGDGGNDLFVDLQVSYLRRKNNNASPEGTSLGRPASHAIPSTRFRKSTMYFQAR
jgi:hypothetical protein